MEFFDTFILLLDGIGPTKAILLLAVIGWLYFRQYVRHHDQVHDRLGKRIEHMQGQISKIYDHLIEKNKD